MAPGGCRTFSGISWCGAAPDPSRNGRLARSNPGDPTGAT